MPVWVCLWDTSVVLSEACGSCLSTEWVLLCSWTIMEAEAYLQYIDSIARDRSRKQWTIDLSWLSLMGIPVPEISVHSALRLDSP